MPSNSNANRFSNGIPFFNTLPVSGCWFFFGNCLTPNAGCLYTPVSTHLKLRSFYSLSWNNIIVNRFPLTWLLVPTSVFELREEEKMFHFNEYVCVCVCVLCIGRLATNNNKKRHQRMLYDLLTSLVNRCTGWQPRNPSASLPRCQPA